MTLLTKQQRTAAITSSYDEKKAAMRTALEWLLHRTKPRQYALTANRFLKRSRVALMILQTYGAYSTKE